MIYLGLKFYLKNTFKIPSKKFIWTQEKNDDFFKYYNDNFSNKSLHKTRNKLEVKQAFVDFFEPVGYILFRMNETKISMKILPYRVEPQNSKYLQTIVQMIEDNKDLVEFDYKQRADQIVIQHKLRRNLYNFVDSIEDEPVNKRELIKYAVKIALDLEEKDFIAKKKKQIFIKLFKYTKRNEVLEEATESSRYNGYSEEELDELYKEYFSNDSIFNFLKAIAKQLFLNIFIEKQISNKAYEKSIYPLIQNIIAEELSEFTKENINFRKGFAGYIFRINFLQVFEYIADTLLKYVSKRDEYVMDWLKYYNGQTFVDDSKQYIAPELITKNNQRWNPAALYGNISTWFKIKDKIILLYRSLDIIEHKLESLLIDGKTPVEYKKRLRAEYDDGKALIEETNEVIRDLIDNKYGLKNKEKLALINEEIINLKKDIVEYKEDLHDISEKLNQINTEKAYKKLEEDKRQTSRDLKREEKVLESNKETYLSIQYAIIKALTSKRKLIKSQ